MSPQVHPTLRYLVDRAIAVGIVVLLFFVLMHRIAPPPAPVHGPVAVFTPSPLEHEVQALVDADKVLASKTASVPIVEQPAVAVIKDTGLTKGLTDAQVSQILAALKPKTVEKVAVASVLAAPTPAPTPSSDVYQQIYAADYAATTHALKDTKIKTDVTITRQEVAPSRIGSLVSAGGSGVSFGLLRKGQYELDVAGLARGSHIVPAASVEYLIPHTSLGIGPLVLYDHGAHPGIAAVIHF